MSVDKDLRKMQDAIFQFEAREVLKYYIITSLVILNFPLLLDSNIASWMPIDLHGSIYKTDVYLGQLY